jgi:hypothetical protein
VGQGQPGQIVEETPISKRTKAEYTGDVVQVAQRLLFKSKALNSNPSPIQTKKE